MKKLIKLIDKYASLIEEADNIQAELEETSEDIEIIKTNVIREVFCYRGIGKLAKELGVIIEINTRNSECFPLEKVFRYRGIRVYQLAKVDEDGRL